MATQALIAAKLSDLATLYRQALGSSEATLLAENWHDLLDDLADGDFDAAVRHHCKTSRYFPTPADILKAHVERPRKPCVYSALSERTFTAEDAQWNAVCAAVTSVMAASCASSGTLRSASLSSGCLRES